MNPLFEVTPAVLVTRIITEEASVPRRLAASPPTASALS